MYGTEKILHTPIILKLSKSKKYQYGFPVKIIKDCHKQTITSLLQSEIEISNIHFKEFYFSVIFMKLDDHYLSTTFMTIICNKNFTC